MRYSLVSRFHGAFLGAVLGESGIADNYVSGKSSRIIIAGGESLAACGKLDIDDWLGRLPLESNQLYTINGYGVQGILAALPVALFYHENPVQLRQNLLRVARIWQDKPLVSDWILALGCAIALSCGDKFTPEAVIPQIVSFLGETTTKTPQILFKIHNSLNCRCTLEEVRICLQREEKLHQILGLAFYCFLSSHEDFRLAVIRSRGVISHTDLTSIITATLSGAYNSVSGISVGWWIKFLPNKQDVVTAHQQTLELAHSFTASWSGTYQNKQVLLRNSGKSSLMAIATPKLL
ncbi:ADP-ribosylglycohydrolase family protein [Calothrix sp. 336/3]|uniref:ADP-ribosylglycohydrolase family protein n=1 Tax=Calothrix sp. 336/3 TaxID=1337936 RepID=UPI0004E3C426|nr:ADP-ribosylglycohydrolase family protein [Calothrix sp. 336/3]AKG21857.1 hypothetical protein IJ00_11830 [Calothrix sp. 336/3]